MPNKADAALGKIAAEKGFLSKEQVLECQAAAVQARKQGEQAGLLQVAQQRGYLTAFQAEQIRKEHEQLLRRKDPIPGYRLVSEIGRGGMGQVYKAIQTSLDRPVAIKVLPSRLAKNPTFIERFHREAISAGKLQHPNVVQVIHADETPEHHHYFVMEYVDGKSVQQILRERGRMDEKEALEIARQMADALCAAHRLNLIHRDIKPANILVTPEGQAKLADFGLARETSDTSMTQTGMMMGTPNYMSPEQARGLKDLDIRTDLYSLGATLYHMVTGRPPYTGEAATEIVLKHIEEELTPPKEIVPGLSDRTNQVIMHLMEKKREDRYSSPEELLEDLDLVIRGEPPVNVVPQDETTPGATPETTPETVDDTAPTMQAPHASAGQDESIEPTITAQAAAPDAQPDATKKALAASVKRLQLLAALAGFVSVLVIGSLALWALRPGSSAPPVDEGNTSGQVIKSSSDGGNSGDGANNSNVQRTTSIRPGPDTAAPNKPPHEKADADKLPAEVEKAYTALHAELRRSPRNYVRIFDHLERTKSIARENNAPTKFLDDLSYLYRREIRNQRQDARKAMEKCRREADHAMRGGDFQRAIDAFDQFPVHRFTTEFRQIVEDEKRKIAMDAARALRDLQASFNKALSERDVDKCAKAVEEMERIGTSFARKTAAKCQEKLQAARRFIALLESIAQARETKDYAGALEQVRTEGSRLPGFENEIRWIESDLGAAEAGLNEAISAAQAEIRRTGHLRVRVRGTVVYVFDLTRKKVRYGIINDQARAKTISFEQLIPVDIGYLVESYGENQPCEQKGILCAVAGDYKRAFDVAESCTANKRSILFSRIQWWAVLDIRRMQESDPKNALELVKLLLVHDPENENLQHIKEELKLKNAPAEPPPKKNRLAGLFAGRLKLRPGRPNYVHITYRFDDVKELQDWRVWGRFGSRARAAEVREGKLTLRSVAWLAHKARFDRDVEFRITMAPSDNFGMIMMFGASSPYASTAPVKLGWFRYDMRVTAFVSFSGRTVSKMEFHSPKRRGARNIEVKAGIDNRRVIFKVTPGFGGLKPKTWLPRDMATAGHPIIVFRPRAMRPREKLVIEEIVLSGLLDRDWIEEQLKPVVP